MLAVVGRTVYRKIEVLNLYIITDKNVTKHYDPTVKLKYCTTFLFLCDFTFR